MDILLLVFQWIVVFVINVIPIFAPPTWIVLSYFNISTPQNIFVLVLIGVTASTAGRYVLAKLSEKFFHFVAPKKQKDNMEAINNALKGTKKRKFIFSFLFALGPLPSNALFIAAGAAKLKMREILAGFAIGRLVSYMFLVFTTSKVFDSLAITFEGQATQWTILIEIIGVLAIIAFFMFDWKTLLGQKNTSGKKWPRR